MRFPGLLGIPVEYGPAIIWTEKPFVWINGYTIGLFNPFKEVPYGVGDQCTHPHRPHPRETTSLLPGIHGPMSSRSSIIPALVVPPVATTAKTRFRDSKGRACRAWCNCDPGHMILSLDQVNIYINHLGHGLNRTMGTTGSNDHPLFLLVHSSFFGRLPEPSP